MGLFGCSKGEELSESEWNERLKEALQQLDFVRELRGVAYSLVGMFFTKDAWISGWVVTDAGDESELRRHLDEIGKTVVEVHRTNYVSGSWVRLGAIGQDGEPMTFEDALGRKAATLDGLAEHYGIPRH